MTVINCVSIKTIKHSWLYNVSHIYIRSDSRGNASILEGDGISHCGKNVGGNKCLILKVADIRMFESTNTKTLGITTKKEKLLILNFILNLVYNI